MSRWIEPYDGATHPDVGDYRDESVADTPEVERYDPADEGPFWVTVNMDPPKPPYGSPERAEFDRKADR